MTSVVTAQQISTIKVIQMSGGIADVEFTPEIEISTRIGMDGIEYSWPNFEYSQIESEQGSNLISFFAVIPIVLPSSDVSVQVLDASSTTVDSVRFPKSEAFRIPSDVTEKAKPSALAEIKDIAERQGYFVASLVIHPIEYLGQNSVRIYNRIRIRISSSVVFNQEYPLLALTTVQGMNEIEQKKNANRSMKKTLASSSVLATGTWYKIGIQETGIYKLDYNYFKNQKISTSFWSNINEIRIYGNGGGAVPQNMTQSYPEDLQEVARLVIDADNDGVFDEGDYILFYGCSTRDWSYNSQQKTIYHYIHPYSEVNYYFLTSTSGTSGKSMATFDASAESATTPQYFTDGVFVEQEKYNLIKSGRRWVGQRFDGTTTSAVFTNSLSGFVDVIPRQYRFSFYSRSTNMDRITIYENGQTIGTNSLPSMTVNASDNTGTYAQVKSFSLSTTGTVTDNRAILKVQYTPNNSNAVAWLDWYEILYSRSFAAVNDFLLWWGKDTTGLVRYEIKNLSSRDVFVFDVTDHANVQQITNLSYEPADPTLCRLTYNHVAGSMRRFAIVGSQGSKTPAALESVNNSNLHGVSEPIKFIVITPEEFRDEALRLKNHRETVDTLRTYVANIEDIYNEFSGGLLDPFAIRNFLRFANQNWTISPKYVLLFGAGHYDYKDITGGRKNWIPPFETYESNYQINSYCSDDSLVILNAGDPRITMAVGRIPVRSLYEAKIAVDKIIRYETESPLDEWRNRITFVADDEFATRVVGDSASVGKEYNHAEDTETLSRYYVPSFLQQNKIFLSQYPDVITASGRKKPGASQALINAINEGALILNYFGHGNETVWAHEEILSQTITLPQLANRTMLPFLIAATCDFSLYDDPLILSAGEEIITMENGGAILEISASRPVYANQNFAMALEIFRQLFPVLGETPRMGDVIRAVKQSYYSVNDKKFHLFGDPTIRILAPKFRISIDSINNIPATNTVSVSALGKVKSVATVRTQYDEPINSFNGESLLKIFGPTKVLKFNNWPAADSFLVTGSVLYSGKVSIKNGQISAVSRIPKDVEYGNKSKIMLYGWSNNLDAAGVTENLVISGTETLESDTVGPNISIYFDNVSFRSGDVVPPTTTLIIRLEDESGINTSTLGIGHKLTATLANPQQEIDLSNYYQTDLDTYQSGEVRYSLSNLPIGKNYVQVKAWDVYNNSSEETVSFEVVAASDIALTHIFNYPNPFAKSTYFTFQRSGEAPVAIEIKIYTVAGRMIRRIELPLVSERFVQVLWDGRDAEGDEVANGIYFYKISSYNIDTRESKEYIGKVARVM